MTVCWTIAMCVLVSQVPRPTEAAPTDFSTEFLYGLIGFLNVLGPKSIGASSIFLYISLLGGGLVGLILAHDFKYRISGFAIILATALSVSWVTSGNLTSFVTMLGALAAPVGLAFFLTGFALQRAKKSAQSIAGEETDTEKRHRLESKRRRAG